MGKRFSRIKQGSKMAAAWESYKNYYDTPRPSRLGTLGARDLDAICYIEPFTVDIAVDSYVMARAYNSGYATLSAHIQASTVADVQNTRGTRTLYNVPKFTPARVIWQRANVRSVSTPPSRFTGQEYLKYNNLERYSCPFGATADTDDLMDSFLDIKARILGAPSAQYEVSRVSLQRERIGV
jgi:hypothetical protein